MIINQKALLNDKISNENNNIPNNINLLQNQAKVQMQIQLII